MGSARHDSLSALSLLCTVGLTLADDLCDQHRALPGIRPHHWAIQIYTTPETGQPLPQQRVGGTSGQPLGAGAAQRVLDPGPQRVAPGHAVLRGRGGTAHASGLPRKREPAFTH